MACVIKRGPHQFQVQIRRKGYPPKQLTFESRREAEGWATVQHRRYPKVRQACTNKTLFPLAREMLIYPAGKAGGADEFETIQLPN